MSKLFYEPFAGQLPEEQEQECRQIYRLKNLSRSLSDPTQPKRPVSHKTLQRVKSAASATRSDRRKTGPRMSSQEEQIGERKSSEHRPLHERTPLFQTFVADLLSEEPNTPIREQPRLSYFSYVPAKGPQISALMQKMRLSEEEEWGQFTTARLLSTEAQGTAITVGYSKAINTDKWIDCCTCMCCVKALFYHCTKDGDYQVDPSSDPCSCQGPGTECLGRWSILGALSVFMPCMLCYPLIQAAHRVQRK